MQLAKEIVTLFHSQEDANIAEENFKNIFSKKEMPENMEELDIAKFIQDGKANVVVILNKKGIVKSKSDAKRLIKQGGIQINGKKLKDFKNPIPLKKGDVIKVGKLKFFRITV